MTCDQIEELILDSLDQNLARVQAGSLSEHLSECLACRKFFEAQQGLDAKFSIALKPVVPPALIRENVFRVIDCEIAGERRKAVQLAAAEAEYQKFQATLRSSIKMQPKRWIDSVAWIFGVVAFGFCLVGVMQSPVSSDWVDQLSIDPRFVSGSIAALFCVLVTIGVARNIRFLFSTDSNSIQGTERS